MYVVYFGLKVIEIIALQKVNVWIGPEKADNALLNTISSQFPFIARTTNTITQSIKNRICFLSDKIRFLNYNYFKLSLSCFDYFKDCALNSN